MFDNIKTPCYVVDKQLIIKNLEILKNVKERTGCKILLASKAFSMYSLFPLIGNYLDGVTSSGLYEAKLGREYMDKEVHIFSPAYIPDDFMEISEICDHIVFNSYNQFLKYKDLCAGKSLGIRINPEFSTQDKSIYDPCAKYSRLGATISTLPDNLDGIEGLHFHTLCEQDSTDLLKTLEAVEKKFGKYFKNIKWLNFGGGHHITRPGYDIELLVKIINDVKEKYNLEVILEPGEAVALNAGFLVSSVLDFNENEITNCILDTSAACHMPDVIEMPYRPRVIGDNENNPYLYQFGGPTCLSGDIIGQYRFDHKLNIGEKIIFEDMAIYSMVKNNTFNGIKLPNIYLKDNDEITLIKEFGYDDFKERL